MAKLNFSLDELSSINSSVVSAKESIKGNYTNIKGCFEELQANVTGTRINGLINTITENLDAIDAKMGIAFEQLTNFLDTQVKNYGVTYEVAVENLKAALTFINENL